MLLPMYALPGVKQRHFLITRPAPTTAPVQPRRGRVGVGNGVLPWQHTTTHPYLTTFGLSWWLQQQQLKEPGVQWDLPDGATIAAMGKPVAQQQYHSNQ